MPRTQDGTRQGSLSLYGGHAPFQASARQKYEETRPPAPTPGAAISPLFANVFWGRKAPEEEVYKRSSEEV